MLRDFPPSGDGESTLLSTICDARKFMGPPAALAGALALIKRALDEDGVDVLADRPVGDFARFRRSELAAAINRLRTLRADQIAR